MVRYYKFKKISQQTIALCKEIYFRSILFKEIHETLSPVAGAFFGRIVCDDHRNFPLKTVALFLTTSKFFRIS